MFHYSRFTLGRKTVSAPVETTYNASTTVTAPSNGTYEIHCFGGGGGRRTNASAADAGAGGGAYSKKNTLSVTAGQQLTLTVGAAGANHNSAPTAGGASSVTFNSVVQCDAKGGLSGTGGGTGGQASSGTGDVKYSGGTGGGGAAYFDGEFGQWYYADGGGGGAAGSGGAGGNGTNGTADFGDVIHGSVGANGGGTYPGTGTGSGANSAPGAGKIILIFTAS